MSHIEIPGTASRLARDVRATVDDLVRVSAKVGAIKVVMDQVAISSNWGNLADYLGFNSVSVGQAITLRDLTIRVRAVTS